MQVVHDAVKEHSRTPFRDDVWPRWPRACASSPATSPTTPRSTSCASTIDDLDRTRGTGGNHAFYLSVPPKFFPDVLRQLKEHGLAEGPANAWRRVVIEKPFGHDLASAQELNRVVGEVFDSGSVFRIDHYLGKETVQNILALRFANEMFEPVWNANYVDHVQITMAEDVGIGGRAGYYDGIGAARDVIQNHLLQLLALTAMEEPVSFEADSVRIEKEKVLSAVRLPADLGAHTARGQYAAGWQGGVPVLGYLQEDGIPADSITDTYAAVRLDIDTRRWAERPVLPAHRQAARPPRHRGRRRLQARPAPAVREDRDRGARPERAGHPGPAGRGPGAAVRVQGPRHGDGGPRRHHGLRVRRGVHRVQPGGVRAADPRRAHRRGSAVPAAPRGRGVLADPRPDRGVLGRARAAGAVPVRHLGPASANEMLARDGRTWRRP